MSHEMRTGQLLKNLGIDPMIVERVVFDHRVGQPPMMTVWFTPNAEQMNMFVSELTTVYRLELKDE